MIPPVAGRQHADPGNPVLPARIDCREANVRDAFSILMARHRRDLLRRCRYRLGNHHDAEEALQETALRAYRGLGGFKGNASLRTWLFAIADNQCNTFTERRARRRISEEVRARFVVQARSDGAQAQDREATRAAVHWTLAQLPEQARDILILRFFLELSLEEIAVTLGVGSSAAKMRLYRALGQFRRHYEGEDRACAA